MEVTKDNFDSLLPRILLDVADSFCVCLDFEFSGIFNQQLRTAASYSKGGGLSLQKRYEEVKEAAEKYQILQVGLTFVHEDEETGWKLLLFLYFSPGFHLTRLLSTKPI